MSEDFYQGLWYKLLPVTSGSGFTLVEGRLRLDRRKKFVTVKVVRHCNRLSREVVGAQSLESSRSSGMEL